MSVLILKAPDSDRMSEDQLVRMAARVQKLARTNNRVTLILNKGWEVIHCDAPLVRATAKKDGHQIVLEFADEINRRDIDTGSQAAQEASQPADPRPDLRGDPDIPEDA